MNKIRYVLRARPGRTFICPVFNGSAFNSLIIALALLGFLPADSAGSDELVISGSNWITDAPTRLAAAAGYFEDGSEPRIRVELADSGKQSLERLMAGDADFALTAAVPLAEALVRLHHQDAPPESWPVVLASIGLSSRTHHVIADSTRGIERPADLAGHALGLLLGTSAHFGWDHFAALYAIAPDAVRLVDARPGELAAGLAAGRFDAVVAWTPYSEQILDQLGGGARSFALQSMDSVSWLLVSRRALIDRHPRAAERVLGGYAGAIELLRADPARAAALLDLPADWLHKKSVAWKLALGWPVIANMEAKFGWNADRLGIAPMRVSPRLYIERGPLERLRPGAVTLPVWIADGKIAGNVGR